jgi:hypothetical protein
MDEVSYLVDPIADTRTNISLKRSRFVDNAKITEISSMDVLRNMRDDQWMEKMKTCGQTERIWEAVFSARGDGDEVSERLC